MLYENEILWRLLREELSYPNDGSFAEAIPESEDPQQRIKREKKIREAATVSLARLSNNALDFAGYGAADNKTQQLVQKWIKASVLHGEIPTEERVLSCFLPPQGEKLYAYLEFLSKHSDIKLADAVREEASLEKYQREQLPQIAEKDQNAFADFIRRHGIDAEFQDMPANQLSPIQTKVNQEKVEALKDNPAKLEIPLIVSQEGKILDGHHRWVAQTQLHPDWVSSVLYVDVPINHLIELGHSFEPSFTKTITESLNEAEGDGTAAVKPETDDDGSAEVKAQADALQLTSGGYGYWVDNTGKRVAQTVTVNGKKHLVKLEAGEEEPEQEKGEEEPQQIQEPETEPQEEPASAKTEPDDDPDHLKDPVWLPPYEPGKAWDQVFGAKEPQRAFSEYVQQQALELMHQWLNRSLFDDAAETLQAFAVGRKPDDVYHELKNLGLDTWAVNKIIGVVQTAISNASNLETRTGPVSKPKPKKSKNAKQFEVEYIVRQLFDEMPQSYETLTPQEVKTLNIAVNKYLDDHDVPELEDTLINNIARGSNWIRNTRDMIQFYAERSQQIGRARAIYQSTEPVDKLDRQLPEHDPHVNAFFRSPDHYTKNYSAERQSFTALQEVVIKTFREMREAGLDSGAVGRQVIGEVLLPGLAGILDVPPDVTSVINSEDCKKPNRYITNGTATGLYNPRQHMIHMAPITTQALRTLMSLPPEELEMYCKGELWNEGYKQDIGEALAGVHVFVHEAQHAKDPFMERSFHSYPQHEQSDKEFNQERDILEGLTEYRAQQIMRQMFPMTPEVEKEYMSHAGSYTWQVENIRELDKVAPDTSARLWEFQTTDDRVSYITSTIQDAFDKAFDPIFESEMDGPEYKNYASKIKEAIRSDFFGSKVDEDPMFTLWKRGKLGGVLEALEQHKDNAQQANYAVRRVLFFDDKRQWFGKDANRTYDHPLMTNKLRDILSNYPHGLELSGPQMELLSDMEKQDQNEIEIQGDTFTLRQIIEDPELAAMFWQEQFDKGITHAVEKPKAPEGWSNV